MQKRLIYFTVCVAMALSACTIHRLDVPQGNIIRPEALAQIKEGMNRRQVLFLLGSPLVQDPFHPQRWDYLYVTEAADKDKKHLTLHFEDDTLKRIEGLPPAP